MFDEKEFLRNAPRRLGFTEDDCSKIANGLASVVDVIMRRFGIDRTAAVLLAKTEWELMQPIKGMPGDRAIPVGAGAPGPATPG